MTSQNLNDVKKTMTCEGREGAGVTLLTSVFKIKVLFCAPLGCIHIETVRPGFSLCTPLVYGNYKIMFE